MIVEICWRTDVLIASFQSIYTKIYFRADIKFGFIIKLIEINVFFELKCHAGLVELLFMK